jgi:hypothetical protein
MWRKRLSKVYVACRIHNLGDWKDGGFHSER